MPAPRVVRLVALAVAVLATPAVPSHGAARGPGSDRLRSGATAKATLTGMTVFKTSNAMALADCLLRGTGFNITGATLTASPDATGGFTSGTGVVNLDAGVVLGTGDVDSLARVNQFENTSTSNLTPGDPSLDDLLDPGTGIVSYDAAVLVIDFTASAPGTLNLSFAFGSEEYNEFAGDLFNDIFAAFLDGTTPADNIARTGGACSTSPGLTIAVNNVNCGIDGTDTGAPNCACFRDNTGATIETELDGLTQVFTVSAPIGAGAHTLKLAIADAADDIYDSAVFIRCQSGEVPALPSTWGRLKVTYR